MAALYLLLSGDTREPAATAERSPHDRPFHKESQLMADSNAQRT